MFIIKNVVVFAHGGECYILYSVANAFFAGMVVSLENGFDFFAFHKCFSAFDVI